MEGAFLQGLSRTLFEELTFESGRVASIDIHQLSQRTFIMTWQS